MKSLYTEHLGFVVIAKLPLGCYHFKAGGFWRLTLWSGQSEVSDVHIFESTAKQASAVARGGEMERVSGSKIALFT